MSRHRRNRRSFLLVEVVIAASVFITCFAAAISLVHQSHVQLRTTQQKQIALELAQMEIERLRSRLPEPPDDCTEAAVEPPQILSGVLRGLKCTRTVRDLDSKHPGLKKVTVSVSWSSSSRSRKTIRLASLIGRKS